MTSRIEDAHRPRISAGKPSGDEPVKPSIADPVNDDDVMRSLYAKRQRIYPREAKGRFASLRWYAVFVLLGLYYVMPWIPWGDRPAVLFDLPARKFYVLWMAFFPQDFLYLTLFLIICALSLFFFTSIAGRLWCGYACPQTVWTEVFMWMERMIEGDRNKRQRLDKAPWDARKLRIKAAKHTVWILFALWTGFTFVGYFVPIGDLGIRTVTLQLGFWEGFWIVFYAFATYGNAGWMREQVCTYMCPYARFQSAMFDRNTLLIAYDQSRGEPRGSRRRNSDHRALGLGDCIDCRMCVQVCPTGIDIRDGLQYTCIGCAACVDACDGVMEQIGYPKGLVRYTTQNAMDGIPVRTLRPRTLVYGGLLVLVATIAFTSMLLRSSLALDVIRDRNALFRDTADGQVENVYTLRLINKAESARHYRIDIEGLDGASLHMDPQPLEVAGGEVLSLPARVRVDPSRLEKSSSKLSFVMVDADDPRQRIREEARFLGPRR